MTFIIRLLHLRLVELWLLHKVKNSDEWAAVLTYAKMVCIYIAPFFKVLYVNLLLIHTHIWQLITHLRILKVKYKISPWGQWAGQNLQMLDNINRYIEMWEINHCSHWRHITDDIRELLIVPLEFPSVPDEGDRGLTTARLRVFLTSEIVDRHLILLLYNCFVAISLPVWVSVLTIYMLRNKLFLTYGSVCTCSLVLRFVLRWRHCCNWKPGGWSGRQSSDSRLHYCRMRDTHWDANQETQ